MNVERLEAKIHPAAIEHAEHGVFAVNRGKGRHAQIDDSTVDACTHAPILRQPAFGDVETGEDLYATEQRRLNRLGIARSVLQDAVDPVSNLDELLQRLDVNV